MKTQMKFQKILALVTLIIAALATVLSLFFCSGILYAVISYCKKTEFDDDPKFGVQALYEYSQSMNDVLVIMGIVLILTVVVLYAVGNSKRRNYYITNMVATGIYVVYAVVFAIVMLAVCGTCFSKMGEIDFDAWKAYEAQTDADGHLVRGQNYNRNIATLVLGIMMSVVVLINAVAWVLNLLWKLKLMKGEKRLLEQGGVASTSDLEVA